MLALAIAVAIGYVPGKLLRPDPRVARLREEINQLDAEAGELAAANAKLVRDIEALLTDVGAIEDRARADLGMVYPDEIVLHVEGATP